MKPDRLFTRREFLSAGAAATTAATLLGTQALAETAPQKKPIWGNLLHLGFNMWADRVVDSWGGSMPETKDWVVASDKLRFDRKLWNDLLAQMAAVKMNLVVIDLGEGIRYESHPEIAAQDAWTPTQLREELARIRSLGIEPIPKLNFSTAHDTWLGQYSRMVSTPKYYEVCKELIAEVVQLFDKPRFFHLGYDEETAAHQSKYSIAIVRQHELWWHDFEFFTSEVSRHGVRPWIWADYVWNHPEFAGRAPKNVVMSNWYYGTKFDEKDKMVKAYRDFETTGYDQIPTASNWSSPENFKLTIEHCRKVIDPSRLLGFLQTPWMPTLEKCRAHHEAAIKLVAEVIEKGT